jgi:hypothetical protein
LLEAVATGYNRPMRIQFYDDPVRGPKPRDEMRFNQIGIYVHEDGRRISVGFDITPFMERPSINILVTNEMGEEAASTSIIEVVETNFNLTLHLRDNEIAGKYKLEAVLYYNSPNNDKKIVDRISRSFDVQVVGEK